MSRVFVDTGFWIALELRADQFHDAARLLWTEVQSKPYQFYTTWLVFSETVAFFQSRGAHEKAVDLGEHLLESPEIEMIPLDEALLRRGWDLLRRHADKAWSLADCVSFVVMREHSIPEALAFDRHFEQAGFRRLM